MVELLIVAPLLLMLILGTIEVGRYLNAEQSLNMLVRESGDLIFRECRNFNPDSQLAGCISEKLRLHAQLQAFGPANSEILVSIYEYSNFVDMSVEEPLPTELITLKGIGSLSHAPQNQSRHSATTLSAKMGIFQRHRRMVVVEGFAQFNFLSTFTNRILGGDRQLYDTLFF